MEKDRSKSPEDKVPENEPLVYERRPLFKNKTLTKMSGLQFNVYHILRDLRKGKQFVNEPLLLKTACLNVNNSLISTIFLSFQS